MVHNLSSRICRAGAALSLVIAGGCVRADSITHTTTVPMTDTGFSNIMLTLPMFNPLSGTLTGIELGFSGDVISDIRMENRSANSAKLTGDAGAVLTLSQPDLGSLTSLLSATVIYNAVAFDGLTDFDGVSGTSFLGIHANGSATLSVPGALFSHFIGIGNIPGLTFSAEGLSNVNGPGRITSQVDTQAGAKVWVNYTYVPVPQVPEPGTYALLGSIGISGLGLVARRRRSIKGTV